MTSPQWTIGWDCGTASIGGPGAMLAPAHFKLPDGNTVQPFAVAPWGEDVSPAHETLPNLLKRLRGEWVCVPFGMPSPPSDLPSGWVAEGDGSASGETWFHGYSSNAHWHLARLEASAIELTLDYPSSHPVRRLTRRVRGVPGRSALAFELEVETRTDVALPIGLHPVFRLPAESGRARIGFGGEARVATYPVDAEIGISRFRPGLLEQPFHAVPCKDGTLVDLGQQPLSFATEELVLAYNHGGSATLANTAEGYDVRLTWDATSFPSCMLWLSNTGRRAYPWSGRFQAIGIEPVVAPFDLGRTVANNLDNPLRQAGIRTARQFTANTSWTTAYLIEVSPLHDASPSPPGRES